MKMSYMCGLCKHSHGWPYGGPCDVCINGSGFMEKISFSEKVTGRKTPYSDYAKRDVELTKSIADKMVVSEFAINNVYFNDPATVVLWSDGTKTVVKCQDGDTYDPEKGLAMAIAKKALGNKGNYCEVFKRWVPEEKKEQQSTFSFDTIEANVVISGANAEKAAKAMKDAVEAIVKNTNKKRR